jgi:cytochrome c biogenesis protein CcmG/thiol:disulfide interchange protein DsbE
MPPPEAVSGTGGIRMSRLSSQAAPAIPSSPWAPRLAALIVGLAVVALLGLFVWGLGRRGTVGQVPVAVRTAPDFELALFGQPGGPSGRWRLSEQGRPAVVNFWASWCIPCEDEAPVLEQVARRYRDRVAFVGIDVQDSDASARAFLERFRVTYPNGQDPDGAISIDYGMSGVPESYFISRDGRIVRKWAGPLDEGRLVMFLEELSR